MPYVALCEVGPPVAFPHMPYVYILRSQINPNQIYTGFTADPARRLKEHNSGKSIHTNKYRPWEFVSIIKFSSIKQAKDFERYLKTGSGIAFSRKHFL